MLYPDTMAPPDPSVASPPTTLDPPPPNHIAESNAPPLHEDTKPRKGKNKVQWNHAAETHDSHNRTAIFDLPSDKSWDEDDQVPPPSSDRKASHMRSDSASAILQSNNPGTPKPVSTTPTTGRKPPILKKAPEKQPNKEKHTSDRITISEDERTQGADEEGCGDNIAAVAGKEFSQQSAQKRAERLQRTVGTRSAPVSRHTSPARPPTEVSIGSPPKTPPPSPPQKPQNLNLDLSDYPLEKLKTRRTYGSKDVDSEEDLEEGKGIKPAKGKKRKRFHAAAGRLMRHHTQRDPRKWFRIQPEEATLKSGQMTPRAEQDPKDYVPRPRHYREGVLGPLMRMYNEQGIRSVLANTPFGNEAVNRALNQRHSSSQPLLDSGSTTPAVTPAPTPVGSPQSANSASSATSSKVKPSRWYKNPKPLSTGSVSNLLSSSTPLWAQHKGSESGIAIRPYLTQKSKSTHALDVVRGRHRGIKVQEAIRIHEHVADVLKRKTYLLEICRALMAYGAPTHRLEEHMRMSARVLEIDSTFLYLPGCMIISFGDAAWHTTDVRIVRCAQKVNLSKLYDAHAIYKEVVHDKIDAEEASERLEEIKSRPDKFHHWWLVLVYGLASACVGPFAFKARPIDLPVAFLLGSILGFMQLIMAPRSDLYANIFEISAAVVTSFVARAFGSINSGKTFCFSALAQSSIALILPGYTVLCGSLELQSKNIVAGSVRMVYAIIYSLFLGYGITVGTTLYGAADKHATSDTICNKPLPFWWECIFVIPFTLCLIIINQGKWKKMPPMLILALVGYFVNHYAAEYFASNAQIGQTLGALAIGFLANLYSRLRHGLAAAILLPAIFVQVPSGLAASGSLVSGVTSANQITNNGGNYTGGITTVSNGTQASGGHTGVEINSAVLNVGYSMIQIAIGITVGLFMSALVVYPLGKRRSGLFSF